MNPESAKKTLPLALLAALAFGACDDPDVYLNKDQFGQPAGALQGTLNYSGPLPCTENGHIVGAGVLFAFDERLLPPPDGFGTSASSFAVVPGDTLFASVRSLLTFNGGRWCPDPNAPAVTVSAPWAMAPLSAGKYQIRGFYNRDGHFDPSFSISNLPTAGDVAGGAIDNVQDVLAAQPKPARYRELPLGYQDSSGVWQMFPNGAKIGEIAVTFALSIPMGRPIFHASSVDNAAPANNPNPLQVHLPSDFQLDRVQPSSLTAGLDEVQASFIRVHLGASVAPEEQAAAGGPPFFLAVNDNPMVYTHEDVDGNGIIDSQDHVFDSQLPSLYPKGFFTRLPDPTAPAPKKSVAVLQGLTIYKSLNDTAKATGPLIDKLPEALIALRPAVLCIDPLDVNKPGALVITHNTDKHGNPTVQDENLLKAALKAKFNRQIDLVYGCLPTGAYAMSLVYQTGQAWTTPNEAGVCAASETPGNATCGTRPRLGSQTATLAIDPPTDAGYCQGSPAPAVCLE